MFLGLFHEDMEPQIKIVNSQALQGNFIDRSRDHLGWNLDANRLGSLDETFFSAIGTGVNPLAAGPVTEGTAVKGGYLEGNHHTPQNLLERKNDLDVQVLEPFPFGDPDTGEVPKQPLEKRLKRRMNTRRLTQNGDRLRNDCTGPAGPTQSPPSGIIELVIVLSPPFGIG
jgi:hypothetical protein